MTQLFVAVSLLVVASLDNSLYAQRPRRGVSKQYTSPEEIERRKDSIKYRLNAELVDANNADEVDTKANTHPVNTPEQIDSILAIWRASSSKEYYDKYFTEGNAKRNTLTEFNSNNTELLNVEQVQEKLLSLSYIREELAAWKKEK